MAEEGNNRGKDQWDILASLTPLILGVAVTGVGGLFTHLYNLSQLQLNQTQVQLNRMQALEKFRLLLISEKPEEREFAYASFVALGYEHLALKIINLRKDASAKELVKELKASPDPGVRISAEAVFKKLPALVYIQIASEGQENKAKDIQQALQQQGISAPGFENIGKKGKARIPPNTEVRYFNAEDQETADSIVAFLKKEKGMSAATAVPVLSIKAKVGNVEIWFSSTD
jgi:hypothetical protein